MDDEVTPSIRGRVDRSFHEPDAAEVQPREVFDEFVVVAVDVGHPGVLAVLPEDLLDYGIGFLIPKPPPP